ncbi:MAG TPA: MATE family efflux transporter [Acidobacteriota bacterium]|nr:MATE family efflux transporter [Acidobacteriota bacterium]
MARGRRSLQRRFWSLTGLNILSNITVPLVSLVDTAMLGHLEHIRFLAGVALATVIFDYVYWSFGFLRMATTGTTAQALGRGDEREVYLTLYRSLALALGIAAIILILQQFISSLGFALLSGEPQVEAAGRDYFRARIWGAPATLSTFALLGWFLGREEAGKALTINVIGNLSNVLLNYLFIIRWGWAAFGAGAATMASSYLMACVGLALLVRVRRASRMPAAEESSLSLPNLAQCAADEAQSGTSMTSLDKTTRTSLEEGRAAPSTEPDSSQLRTSDQRQVNEAPAVREPTAKFKESGTSNDPPSLGWRDVLDWQGLSALLRLNGDILLRTLGLITAFGLFANFSAKLGTSFLAANTILLRFLSFAAFAIDGVAFAAESLAGILRGGRDQAGLHRLVRLSLTSSLAMAAGFVLLLLGADGALIGLLTSHQDIVKLALDYRWGLFLTVLLGSLAYAYDGLFLGLTAGRLLRNSMLAATFLVFLPLALTAVAQQANGLLWISLIAFMLARCALLGWFGRRLLRV